MLDSFDKLNENDPFWSWISDPQYDLFVERLLVETALLNGDPLLEAAIDERLRHRAGRLAMLRYLKEFPKSSAKYADSRKQKGSEAGVPDDDPNLNYDE